MNNSESKSEVELAGVSNASPNPSKRRAVSSISDSVMTMGRDEMNLADFPLAGLASRPAKGATSLVFQDEVWDKHQRAWVKKRLTISPCTEYGLPTASDDEVILGLIQLMYAARFADRKLSFVPAELFRVLGWPGEGRNYDRLEESLKRWVGVTLYYDHAWWDRKLNTWMDEHFHLLDNVVIPRGLKRRRKKARSGRRSPWTIIWNETVFKSFQDGYLRKLDMSVLRRLKSTPAKRMYRFLGKRFHFTNHLTFDLRVFACERVGFSRKGDNGQLKRRVHEATQELENVGFLERLTKEQRFREVRRGKWEVIFSRSPKTKREDSGQRSACPLEKALVERGVREPVAAELVRDRPAATIRKCLREFDELRTRGGYSNLENPPGLLISWIKNRRNIPSDSKPPTTKPRVPKPATTEAAERHTQQDAIHEYLERLSPGEWESFETEAMSQADCIQLAGYKRAKAMQNKRLMNKYRDMIIKKHVSTLLNIARS